MCHGPGVTVVATHGLFADAAVERLQALPVSRVVVSDSVPAQKLPLPVEYVSVAPLLAEAVRNLGR